MIWPNCRHPRPTALCRGRSGYTLVEIVLATLLTLIMLGAVITYFGTVGETISNSRSALEMIDRLRSAAAVLRSDLRGITVTTIPPRRPEDLEGYFQYTEGPIGVAMPESSWAANLDVPGIEIDTTVGDLDDMLLFTTRSVDEPFVGRFGTGTIESPVAEVAWFVRGRTLYRRVLLVTPEALARLDVNGNGRIDPGEWGAQSFYNGYDISVRWQVDASGNRFLLPNTLGDLTKPEFRYAHQSARYDQAAGYPFHPYRVAPWQQLRLPLLGESAHPVGFGEWFNNGTLPSFTLTPRPAPLDRFDAWRNPCPFVELDPTTGIISGAPYNIDPNAVPRLAEDVVLTNVIGFDVKAFDPAAPVVEVRNGNAVSAVLPGDAGYLAALASARANAAGYRIIAYGAYVDLNYAGDVTNSLSAFAGPGILRPGVPSNLGIFYYDTGSTHYEKDGLDQFGDGAVDLGTNGFDDNGNGVVDDPAEMETSPPYPVPLRGIQVKIRCFEPDSRQIREVTVVQEFLPK